MKSYVNAFVENGFYIEIIFYFKKNLDFFDQWYLPFFIYIITFINLESSSKNNF